MWNRRGYALWLVVLLVCADVQPAYAGELDSIFAGVWFIIVGFVALLGSVLLLAMAVQREVPLPGGKQRWGRVLGQGVVAIAPLVA